MAKNEFTKVLSLLTQKISCELLTSKRSSNEQKSFLNDITLFHKIVYNLIPVKLPITSYSMV